MITNPKILWAPTVALVHPAQKNAYVLRFLKEDFATERVEVQQMPVPQGLLGVVRTYTSSVTDAYYLARVQVRPLEGNTLPKGILTVRVDGETVVTGKLSSFLPEKDPLDPQSPYRWRKTDGLIKACAMVGKTVDSKHQIGFMLTNMSKVQVYLSDVKADQKHAIEIKLLSALYTSKPVEGKDKEKT